MNGLRVLVVDDEPAARRGLGLLLRGEAGVAVVGEACTAAEAREAMARLHPDVVFLDVRMPGGSGLEAVRETGPDAPVVVLVTAHAEHALEAFDVEAVDYLLKPFNDRDFRRALDRARRQVRRIRAERVNARIAEALAGAGASGAGGADGASGHDPPTAVPGAGAPTGAGPDRIKVRSGSRVRLIDPGTVQWVEAEGDYVRLHTGETEHLLRTTMRDMARRLGDGYVRVHRSTIVREDCIREIRPRGRGRYALVLRDGSRRPVSPNGYERLKETLGL